MGVFALSWNLRFFHSLVGDALCLFHDEFVRCPEEASQVLEAHNSEQCPVLFNPQYSSNLCPMCHALTVSRRPPTHL